MQYVALLRGINLGGHRAVAMKDLREMFEAAGFSGVKTVATTGNVIFAAPKTNANAVTKKIEAKLQETFGFEVKTILRTMSEIEEIVGRNPFRGLKEDGS